MTEFSNPTILLVIMGAMSLAPFVAIMLTSFVKISVVLSILRNALGTQQAPPNQVINGLAFILTIFIMAPVGQAMYHKGAQASSREVFSLESIQAIYRAAGEAKEPLRNFLAQHAHPRDRVLFADLSRRLDAQARDRERQAAQAAGQAADLPPASPEIRQNDFIVLIPAFVTSELKEAFEAGFLIYLPFIVIDFVVANVLTAMGMSMLQPASISLPFKLLLFVMADGWYLIVRGLVLSYT